MQPTPSPSSLNDIMSEQLALEMTFNNVLERPESKICSLQSDMSEFIQKAGISESDFMDLHQLQYVLFVLTVFILIINFFFIKYLTIYLGMIVQMMKL